MAGRYSIVPARTEDLQALPQIERDAAALLRGLVPDSVLASVTDEAHFAAAQRSGLLWVALVDDNPVGFALVRMLSDLEPHLEELDVLRSYGRRGIGSALVRAVCAWARRSEYTQLTLTTFRSVPWNMPFYAALGFGELSSRNVGPALAAAIEAEASRGLSPSDRVAMAMRLGAPRAGAQGACPL